MLRISPEELEEINKLRKENKNKRVEQILKVLVLRAEGKKNSEISKETGYNERYVTILVQKYKALGLKEFARIKQTSHNRRLTEEEEAEILERFEKEASEGKELTVADINEAFRERLGEDLAHNYVYRVLARHGWRKVMPRSKHPKAASKEEQDSSKKLRV